MTTQVHHTLESALDAIDRHDGAPELFELMLAHDLMDPLGLHLAIITDRALAHGWEPAGCQSTLHGLLFKVTSKD